MKKYMKIFLLPVFAFIVVGFNGCILDAFDTLTQGFPVSIDVNISDPTGALTSLENTETIDLNDSEFYSENQSKIQKIKLVKIAYRTKSVTPASLSGNLNIKVTKEDGTILFSKNVNNARPADYISTPYELKLSQAEVQLVNAYIGTLSNRRMIATVTLSGVAATIGTAKTLNSVVDVVFEMEYEL